MIQENGAVNCETVMSFVKMLKKIMSYETVHGYGKHALTYRTHAAMQMLCDEYTGIFIGS